jgi:hypothetical protein
MLNILLSGSFLSFILHGQLAFLRILSSRSFLSIPRARSLSATMTGSREANEDTHSILSRDSGLYLGEDDQRYLEALKDEDYVVTKNTRHPLGLFSVVALILQQVIGQSSMP